MKPFSLMMLFVLSISTFGGHQKSGGSSVVCFSDISSASLDKIKESIRTNMGDPLSFVELNQIQSVTTTDIFISSSFPNERIESYRENQLNEDLILKDVFSLLREKKDNLAFVLPYVLRNEIKWIPTNYPVVSALDSPSLNTRLPENCVQMFVAIHDYSTKTRSRVFVDDRLYSRMDSLSKAALKLHEIVLRRSDSLIQGSSEGVQNVVDFLLTSNLKKMSTVDIQSVMLENGISYNLYNPEVEVLSESIKLKNEKYLSTFSLLFTLKKLPLDKEITIKISDPSRRYLKEPLVIEPRILYIGDPRYEPILDQLFVRGDLSEYKIPATKKSSLMIQIFKENKFIYQAHKVGNYSK